MRQATESDLMVKYQFEVDDETWEEWKNTVPRSKSLEQRLIELIEADTEGRVLEDQPAREPPAESLQTDEGARHPEPPADDESGQGSAQEDAEDALRSLDLPGSGSKYEARVDALLAFYEHLRNNPGERVSKGDLEDLVEERDLDVAYSSFNSFWGNWVKKNESQGRDFNTLAQLPGVEMDGDDYVYTDGSA